MPLQGGRGQGLCSSLGKALRCHGSRDFVLGTGSPALGTRVQRSKRAHAGLRTRGATDTRGLRPRVQRGDVSAEVPRGGHATEGTPQLGVRAPAELGSLWSLARACSWWLCRSPRAGTPPPCIKSPLQVGLSASQTEFEDGAPVVSALPHPGRGPLQPPSGQPGRPGLAYLCPLLP